MSADLGADLSPRPQSAAPGDVLSVSFADDATRHYGQVRLEVGDDADTVGVLIALFAGARTLVASADGRPATPAPEGSHAALETRTCRLESPAPDHWSLRFVGEGGEGGEGALGLTLVALDPPWRLEMAGAPARAAWTTVGQGCRVAGEIRSSGSRVRIEGIGQVTLSRSAGAGALRQTREVDVWDHDRALLAVRARRSAGARDHEDEQVSALLLEPGVAVSAPVDEARLSSTYDGDGRPTRAGLELWPTVEAEYPRRAAGELLCGSTVLMAGEREGPDRGASEAPRRWDCAFLRWHLDGRRGVGPYSVLRSADDQLSPPSRSQQ